jgi:hypothetical protein
MLLSFQVKRWQAKQPLIRSVACSTYNRHYLGVNAGLGEKSRKGDDR